VVSYDRKEKAFSLAFELADEAAVADAKSICEQKIAEWIQKKAERDPSGGVDASTRYRVLKAARGRCELCGISSKLSPIDIDHIVPRNHADKHGFVVKDGIRMPLDDERNLQALCVRCNRAKRDKDKTDFRLSQQKLVRDRIPDIIHAFGLTAVTRTIEGRELSNGSLRSCLKSTSSCSPRKVSTRSLT
jgi:5-methylcytosine-specific restriction endonuclease McrA